MPHWIVRKGKDYIYDLDELGRPLHTKDIAQALKFGDFTLVMDYVSMGYCAIKYD